MLSDPSILINDMFNDNRVFIENLARELGGNIYVDEAHHMDFNPYSISIVTIHRELDSSRAFEVFLAVAVLAVAIESGLTKKILALIKKVFPEKKENIFEDLPEWVDKNKFEKMLKEIETGSKIGDIHGWNRLSGESKKRGW